MGKNKKNKSGGGGGGGGGNASGGAPAMAAAIPVAQTTTPADDNDALKVRLAEAKERLNRIQAVIGAIGVEDPKETLATETKIMAEATEKLQTIEKAVAATPEQEADTLTETASSGTGKKKKHKKGHNNNPPPGCPIAVQHPPTPKPETKAIVNAETKAISEPKEVTDNFADDNGDKEETGGSKKKKNKNKNKKQGQQVSDGAPEEGKVDEVEVKSLPVVVVPVAPVAIVAQTPSTDVSKEASPSAGVGKKKNKNKNKNKNKGADSENEELVEIKESVLPVAGLQEVSVDVASIEVKAEIVTVKVTKEVDEKKEETKPEISLAEQGKTKSVEAPVNSKANKKKNKNQNQTPHLEKLSETQEVSAAEPIKELKPITAESKPITTETVKVEIAKLPSSDELLPKETECKILHEATIHDDSGSAKIWKMLDEITDQPTLQESMSKSKKNNKREAPKPPAASEIDNILPPLESLAAAEDLSNPSSNSQPSEEKLMETSQTLPETAKEVVAPAPIEVLPAEPKLSMADLLKLDMKKNEAIVKSDVPVALIETIVAVSPITSDSPIAESKKTLAEESSKSDVETDVKQPEVGNKKKNKHNKQFENAKQQSIACPMAPISEPENFEITSPTEHLEAHAEKITAPAEQVVMPVKTNCPITHPGAQDNMEVVPKLEAKHPTETSTKSGKPSQDHTPTIQTHKQKQQQKKGQAPIGGQKALEMIVSADSVKVDQTTSMPFEVNNEKVINKEMEKQLLSASLSKLIDTVPQALDKEATVTEAKELPRPDEPKPKENSKPKEEQKPKEELQPKNEPKAEDLSKSKTDFKQLEPNKDLIPSIKPQESLKIDVQVKPEQTPATGEATKTEILADTVKPETPHLPKEETKCKGEIKQKECTKSKDAQKAKNNVISKEKPKPPETKPQVAPKTHETPKPQETLKPQENPKPQEAPKTGETSKLQETPKSQETPKTQETPKPQEKPKPKEAPKSQQTPKTMEKSKQDSGKPEPNKSAKPLDVPKPAQVQPKPQQVPKGKSPKPQEAPKQNEQAKQPSAPKPKDLEPKINLPSSDATAAVMPKDTPKGIEVAAVKAKPDSPKLGRQEPSKKSNKELPKKDLPKTKSPIKEDLTPPLTVPLKVATQDPPKHDFAEVPLPAAPTPPPAAAASATTSTPDLNKNVKKDDPKSKKDQKNQKPNKTKAKAPQPPIEETPPDIPMDMSIISESMIESSPASSSGQATVTDEDLATAEDTSLIFSDSKNVQRSDFAQSVKTVTAEKDEAKSLGSDTKIEPTNQKITEAAREAAISPTSNKRNKNQANKRNAAEALESKTHELPEKTAQEKMDAVEFPAVQLMDILEPKMTSGTGLKPGNVVGTVRASPRANQSQKKVTVEKPQHEVKSDQAVNDPKLTSVNTVDSKQITGTIPKVGPAKTTADVNPEPAKPTDLTVKSSTISQKPQVAPKPENISRPQVKKGSATPPPTVTTKPTQAPVSQAQKPNEKPKSPTNIKPEIPPRPKNLVSSPQPPKKAISPLSIVPTPSSPSSSNASASPSPLPYDDEEYVEYKFSPRPVFMCTICQVCKIPLHSYVHCKQCQMISYCTVEHMQEDELNHKSLCAAIQEIAKKRGMQLWAFK